jgi:hypothetical protein
MFPKLTPYAGVGITYFIIAPELNRVKIGRSSSNVWARLEALQIGCPCDLHIECAVNAGVESQCHRAFEDERVRGEWFDVSPRLRRFMDLIRLATPQPFKPFEPGVFSRTHSSVIAARKRERLLASPSPTLSGDPQ